MSAFDLALGFVVYFIVGFASVVSIWALAHWNRKWRVYGRVTGLLLHVPSKDFTEADRQLIEREL